ncbi:heparan-alpha-glucosaminide N-acetyltransferase [Methanocrinis sp.]|uniref:heparan-alpha-glucosaminide N-acetyltransferase n=1 Tax=Methanocrinis sp. TaxID=3101522 RepID=UPI003D0F753A
MERYWEVDLLRGIALVMMIAFHALYDLDHFSGPDLVDLHSGIWPLFAKVTASIFLLLVGISLHISSARTRIRGDDPLVRYLRRGGCIFSWGMAITLSTLLLLGEGFVVFGILHLIGVSIIISRPLLRRPLLALFLGSTAIFAGLLLRQISFDTPWLLWLGLVPSHFFSVDYFPILPWFGVVAMGIFLGGLLYPKGTRRISLPDLSTRPFAKQICLLGRNSLAIYLLHQPILIISMQLLGVIEVGEGLALHLP